VTFSMHTSECVLSGFTEFVYSTYEVLFTDGD
jgi:hypothetical protein